VRGRTNDRRETRCSCSRRGGYGWESRRERQATRSAPIGQGRSELREFPCSVIGRATRSALEKIREGVKSLLEGDQIGREREPGVPLSAERRPHHQRDVRGG